MNNEKNQNIWIEKVHQNLLLRGRSEKTFENYKSALLRFLNYYSSNTIIKNLNEEKIIDFLKYEYLDKNKCPSTYNIGISAIRLMFLVCFNKSLNRLLLPNCKLPKRLPTMLSILSYYLKEDIIVCKISKVSSIRLILSLGRKW